MTRAGMTLIEAIVVLFILGIAAAMVAPAIGELANEDPLERSAREVLLLLRDARRLSLERGAGVNVTIDPRSNRYWIYSAEDSMLRSDALRLASGVALVAQEDLLHVAFAPLGASSSDAVSLEAGGQRRSLIVNRWSGEISIEP